MEAKEQVKGKIIPKLLLTHSKEDIILRPDTFLHNRFKILHVIGAGGFGSIYEAYDIKLERLVAIKVECKLPRSFPYSPLELEANVMNIIHKDPGPEGRVIEFPKCHYFRSVEPYRKHSNSTWMLAMDLLGPSLDDLLELCGGGFSLPTTLLIADQLLHRLETLHGKGILHRDIKPGNILIDKDKKDTLYLIVFGLAMLLPTSGKPIIGEEEPETLGYVGTTRYMSCRAHKHLKQGKKDDLESLVYVLVYLCSCGQLPWRSENLGAQVRDAGAMEKNEIVCEMKMMTEMTELFKKAPMELAIFGDRVRGLKIHEEPQYEEYRMLLRSVGHVIGVDYNGRKFDWSEMDVEEFKRQI